MSESTTNLVHLILKNLNERPNHQALWAKKQGIYTPMTYQDCFEHIKWLSLGLSDWGVMPGDRVALLSGNRPEWVVVDFAILSAQAVVVPIYLTLSPTEIAHILTDCQATMVVVETQAHVEMIASMMASLPHLRQVVSIERASAPQGVSLLNWDDVMAKGKNSTPAAYDALLTAIESISSDQLASIVYTSGTTGEPKGVMLTHGNFLSNIQDISLAIPISAEDVVLSFLPLSHVFERTAGYYCVLNGGGTIYYAESIDTVAANMMEVNPTVLVSVPRLYEKIHDKVDQQLTGLKRRLFNGALRWGYQRLDHRLTWWQRCVMAWVDRLFFLPIRRRTGNRLRFFVSGGAPLNPHISRFFGAIGLPIIEGYGLTETSPVIACNRPQANRLGTVGKAMSGLDIRLADDGELLVKGGSVFKGYWQQPDATAAAIDAEGFFHTGDIAHIDSDGYIHIVDRKKDMIVLSNGKKIPPQWIERHLNQHKFIAQSMVIGDGHSFLTALLVPHLERIQAANGQGDTPLAPAEVSAVLQAAVNEVNQQFARFQQVKRMAVLPTEWTVESGELTPSLKLRRKVIQARWASVIDGLYKE